MSAGIPQSVHDATELVIREYGVDDALGYLQKRFREADPDEQMRVAAAISAYRRRFA